MMRKWNLEVEKRLADEAKGRAELNEGIIIRSGRILLAWSFA
jgi:hypothetical protein